MSNANALELGMLDLINGERAAMGLDPLRLITLLNSAAEDHSRWMLDADQFSHTGEGGSSPSDRMEQAGYPFEGGYTALENIGWQSARGAEGFEDDVAQVHEGLMASPGHRANILNPDARDIGIGIETGTFSGSGGDYEAVMVTQVFADTDADTSSWIDPGTGAPADDDPMPEDDPLPDESPVAEDDPAEHPVAEDDAVDDPVAEDDPADDPVAEDDSEDPVGDDIAEDDIDEAPDEVVAEDDTGPDAGDGDGVEEDDTEEPPFMPEIALPCDLTQFTVDLSDAFEFRQEGDQLIWTTSEEKLTEVFLKAFEDWSGQMAEPDIEDMEDLMLDEMAEDTPALFGPEDEDTDEWLMADCA